jgi:hypothetical protein
MVKIDFWVEGIADQKFLSDVISEWFEYDFKWDDKNRVFEYQNPDLLGIKIRSSGGAAAFTSKDGWNKISPLFKSNAINGVKDIIILDADEDYDQKIKEVNQVIDSEGFDSTKDLYLWPDNQKNKGKSDLETLLEEIINLNNKDIFDCWKNYEMCLDKVGKNYTTPARKTKIYAYLEALLGESNDEKEKIKERKRDYKNTGHWNLDGSTGPLKPLKEFLKSHIDIHIDIIVE